MEPRDLIITTGEDGKKIRSIKTASGITYRLEKKIGEGGVGKVFRVTAVDGPNKGRPFVLKEYSAVKDADNVERLNKTKRQYLQILIQRRIKNDAGEQHAAFVQPLEVVEFSHTNSFGYIMPLVDLNEYVSLRRLRHDYPDMDVICCIGENISNSFQCLNTSMLHFADLKESDIYLHPRTGEIKIINTDDIVPADSLAFFASDGCYYMASEMRSAQKAPDVYTDRYMLAVFLLRLLTGGFPYEGPDGVTGREPKNMINDMENASESNVTFVFGAHDPANSIRNEMLQPDATDFERIQYASWQNQSRMWERLPAELQKNFVCTFVHGNNLEMRHARVSALEWQNTFSRLKENLVTCSHCGRKTFAAVDTCFYCGCSPKKQK